METATNRVAALGSPAYPRLGAVLACILEVESHTKFRWHLDDTGFAFRFHTPSRGWSRWTPALDLPAWNLAADDPNGTAERLAARDLYPMEWIQTERWAVVRPCSLYPCGASSRGVATDENCLRCKNRGRYLERSELHFDLLWRFASEPEIIATVEGLALEMGRRLFGYELSVAWRTEKLSDLGNPSSGARVDSSFLGKAMAPFATAERWLSKMNPINAGELPRPTEPWHQPLQELMRYGYEYGGAHDEQTLILIAPSITASG